LPAAWVTQVRAIVWSASDVPSGDQFEDMNDLYIKCRMGADVAGEQSTDTHLRLPAGQKGSFNWRMKFPLKLPVSEDCEGGARLTIEVWLTPPILLVSLQVSIFLFRRQNIFPGTHPLGVGPRLHHLFAGTGRLPDRPVRYLRHRHAKADPQTQKR
jgi:hypothetical protein